MFGRNNMPANGYPEESEIATSAGIVPNGMPNDADPNVQRDGMPKQNPPKKMLLFAIAIMVVAFIFQAFLLFRAKGDEIREWIGENCGGFSCCPTAVPNIELSTFSYSPIQLSTDEPLI
jgi:hypothetical protein